MKLWKVYFTNGNFTLIWAEDFLFEAQTKDQFRDILFVNGLDENSGFSREEVARFNRENIAGFEKCGGDEK